MPDYRRMADHLETERLILRPWALTDAEDLSALHAERGAGTPAVAEMWELIAGIPALTEEWGFTTLPIRRRDAGDFIGYRGLVLEKLDFTRHHTTTEDRGEIVWLTRALSPA